MLVVDWELTLPVKEFSRRRDAAIETKIQNQSHEKVLGNYQLDIQYIFQ